MSHDELKEKGNECIRQKNYKDAALYYTSALSKDPCSHTVFSNRSLAYSKLQQFESALQDANKCIELSPNFARGYLRKSVALAGLGENRKALAAAEQGYKLRGSDTICRSCVGQWLEANDSLLKEKVDRCLQEIDLPQDVIPRGCRILSDDYLTIFLNVLLCRLQFTTTGVEVGFIASCIRNLFEELDRILQLFGHVPASTHSMEWLVAFALASKVDPSTSRVPQGVAASFVGKSTEFSTWLDTEVDHALYPILSPIISLVMIAINARCISLNVLNSDQSVIQTTCQACLPFFQKPILSGPDYLLQHISVYKELLEAFGTSNYVFTQQDIKFGQDCIAKLESLLKRCPTDDISKDVSDKAAVSISLAQIRLQESPKFDPVEHAPRSGKAISRIGAVDREHLKAYAGKKLEALKNDMSSVMMEFSHEDVQDLLSCIGSLLDIGEHEMAVEACKVAESVYLNLFQQRISNSTFGLDDAGMYFHTPQTMMLQNICSFLATDKKMVANIVVKWKCIYSEFRAILIQLGIGKHYINTFQAIQQMKVGTELDQGALLLLTEQHRKETNKFLEERGQFVLTCLLNQSYEQVQSILQPNQLVLEYCIEREGESDDGTPIGVTGVLIVMQPGNEVPLSYPIDFKKILPLAREWTKMLSSPKLQQEAMITAKDMCDLMLPSDVKALLSSPSVKNVFMCPDMSLSILPLELLEFEDGEILGEKCTISYLSSSRELLRNLVTISVSAAYEIVTKNQAENEDPNTLPNEARKEENSIRPTYDLVNIEYPSTKSQTDSSQEPMCKKCVIVAAPNYDLEMPTSGAGSTIWGSLLQGFASLFSESSKDAMLAESLSGAEAEAEEVRKIFMGSAGSIKVIDIMKDDATMMAVLQLESPFILHFSTHGFSNPYQRGCRSSFWDDTLSGLLLAGCNTYRRGNHVRVLPEAGTGELTSLAACGMNLQGTHIVYLSTCVSSYGLYSYGETINSLAQAFRSAGAQTVIATLWQIVDDTAQHFAAYFYEAAFKSGVRPSEALTLAKQKIREETTYTHWIYWSCFVCIGEDRPLFP